jgi:hypothetical protein
MLAVLVILWATISIPQAQESESLAKLKAEKAALEKRLTEINNQLDKIWTGQGVQFLGMTLADFTPELASQYGLPADRPQAVIVRVQDGSYFLRRTVPTAGCSFWIVEHPANGFLLHGEKSPSQRPKSVRELVAAIVSCTVSPEEYLAIKEQQKSAALSRAEALKDKPVEQERFLKIANAELPNELIGKYVCRIVYNYPNQRGTMTTEILMDKADLDRLRELLEK